MNKNVLTSEEIIEVCVSSSRNIKDLNNLYAFINDKTLPTDDEIVYFNEDEPIELKFEDIKNDVMLKIKKIYNGKSQ